MSDTPASFPQELPPPGFSRATRRGTWALIVIYVILRACVPFLRVPPSWGYSINAFVVSPLFICLTVALVYQLVCLRWKPLTAIWILLGCLVPYVGLSVVAIRDAEAQRKIDIHVAQAQETSALNQSVAVTMLLTTDDLPPIAGSLPAQMILAQPIKPPPFAPPNMWRRLAVDVAGKTLLMLLLVAGGVILSRLIREPNLLVPVAPVAAAADVFTVLAPSGITQQALRHTPELVSVVSQTVPQVATTTSQAVPVGQPFAIVGPGDVLFLAFFFACLAAFNLRLRLTMAIMCIVLTAYLQVVLLLGDRSFLNVPLQALPALVPMAAVVLIVNWRSFRLSASEKVLSAVAWLLSAGFIVYAAATIKPTP